MQQTRLPIRTSATEHPSDHRATEHKQLRAGISTLELIVALTLLTTALTVGTQVVVRAKRVMDDHRDYRLALDEVSNSLEVLTLLPQDELISALGDLQPSQAIAHHLDNVEISATWREDDLGNRIVVQLTWGSPHQTPKAVVLSGWHTDASKDRDTGASDEGGET